MENIVGESPAMKEIFEMVQQVAPTRATVLLLRRKRHGQGTCREGHSSIESARKAAVCDGALRGAVADASGKRIVRPRKGARSPARTRRRIGRFEQAQGGTLFLDEIGEIDATIQVKLLRFLGERTFERVGSNKTLTADVRLIAATNKNLEELVKAGKFREDLFFRLRVVEIHLPPLRERTGRHSAAGAKFFCASLPMKTTKSVNDFTADALEALMNYSWPGNVRELRTAMEHAVVLCRGERISVRDLPPSVRGGGDDGRASSLLAKLDLTVKEAEKQLIVRALKETRRQPDAGREKNRHEPADVSPQTACLSFGRILIAKINARAAASIHFHDGAGEGGGGARIWRACCWGSRCWPSFTM